VLSGQTSVPPLGDNDEDLTVGNVLLIRVSSTGRGWWLQINRTDSRVLGGVHHLYTTIDLSLESAESLLDALLSGDLDEHERIGNHVE
jgi:hypothetical protein